MLIERNFQIISQFIYQYFICLYVKLIMLHLIQIYLFMEVKFRIKNKEKIQFFDYSTLLLIY